MVRRIARSLLPGPLRRWMQWRKMARLRANYRPRVVEHMYGGVSLRLELADPLAGGWYDHDWVVPEVPLLSGRGRLKTGARVFDIGAHQGVMGLILANHVGPTGQVVVVEPNPYNLKRCDRNAELNGATWVTRHCAAVSDRPGSLRFNQGLNGQAAELCDYGGVMTVPATTINELTDLYGPPDIVTLDVEGFECRALCAASKAFAAEPDWCVEVHVGEGLEAAGGSAEQVLSYFSGEQYERHVHSDGESSAIPFDRAPAEKFRTRFFLTALRRDHA